MRKTMLIITAAFVALTLVEDASARSRHRSHRTYEAYEDTLLPSARGAPIPYGYSFYPDEIEGGVSGNLPFNNQIRKHVDPLNANGGGG